MTHSEFSGKVFPSCSKINLYLKLLSKDKAGYHELLLDFFPLELHDLIEISPGKDSHKVEFVGVEVEHGNNTVSKALSLMEKEFGPLSPCNIKIRKNIPVEAGLGGGSSNGATTLKALNEIFSLGAAPGKLGEMAEEIGSDVPFFLNCEAGTYTGRGEIFVRQAPAFPFYVTLFVPSFGISTAQAFSSISEKADSSGRNEVFDYSNPLNLSPEVNDFWDIALPEFERLSQLREKLLFSGFDNIFLTGSGSTLYSLSEKPVDNSQIKKILRIENLKSVIPTRIFTP